VRAQYARCTYETFPFRNDAQSESEEANQEIQTVLKVGLSTQKRTPKISQERHFSCIIFLQKNESDMSEHDIVTSQGENEVHEDVKTGQTKRQRSKSRQDRTGCSSRVC
jgi:hypothetical protein